MTETKTEACPMDVNICLQKAEKYNEDEFPYRELVGNIRHILKV